MMAARNKQQKKHNKRNPTKILQGTFQQVKNGRKMVSCCVLVLKKMTTQNAQMVKAKPKIITGATRWLCHPETCGFSRRCADATLVFPKMVGGGLMIFDDYL